MNRWIALKQTNSVQNVSLIRLGLSTELPLLELGRDWHIYLLVHGILGYIYATVVNMKDCENGCHDWHN